MFPSTHNVLGTVLSSLKGPSHFYLTKQVCDMGTMAVQFNGESTGLEVELGNVMTSAWDMLKAGHPRCSVESEYM